MAVHSFLVICGHKVATFSCSTYDVQTSHVSHDNVDTATLVVPVPGNYFIYI